ncbi:MAG: hypothetical protein Fur0043_07200 [Anaerolineales bacterium]
MGTIYWLIFVFLAAGNLPVWIGEGGRQRLVSIPAICTMLQACNARYKKHARTSFFIWLAY